MNVVSPTDIQAAFTRVDMTRIQRNRVALLGGLAVLICAGLTAAGVLGLVSVAVALIATAGLVGATHARYQRALQDRQQLGEARSPLSREDIECLCNLMRADGLALQWAPVQGKANRDVVLAAVRKNGLALQYADSSLQIDPEVVRAALQQNALGVLQCFPNDHFIALAAVSWDGLLLQHMSWQMRYNEEICMSAVAQNGEALRWVEVSGLQMLLRAVRQNGLALRHIKGGGRSYPDIALQAVQQNGLALAYARQTEREDQQTVRVAVRQNGLALAYASADLRAHPPVVWAALEQNPAAIAYVAPALLAQPEFARFVEEHTLERVIADLANLPGARDYLAFNSVEERDARWPLPLRVLESDVLRRTRLLNSRASAIAEAN